MSVLLAGVLKSTFGLLFDKLRDRTARRLKDGEFFDEKLRRMIVRDLDDINTQLKGLSREKLLASIYFFKEGVNRLYSSLGRSDKSSWDEHSTSKCDGATATTKSQYNALESASKLSKATGNLEITSQKHYESAKESFKESRKLVTVAFSNEALIIEDRLLASKLRIASRILECLDDKEAAVRDCLLYLEDLQNLPAIQEVFSLWRKREKDITDHLRVRFNKKKRMAVIESIRMINALLVELATNCSNITMGIYDWPTIEIGKTIYHPILDDRKVLKNIPSIFYQASWIRTRSEPISPIFPFALTSKGEYLSLTHTTCYKVTKSGDERDLFYKMPPKNDGTIRNTMVALDVDKNDNVYILISSESVSFGFQTKLLTLDANGNMKADRFLEIDVSMVTQMSVIQDGVVIIYSRCSNTANICHSTNAVVDYKLDLPTPDRTHLTRALFSLAVSNNNDIIAVCLRSGKATMYIISLHDGKLKREVEIPIKTDFPLSNQTFLNVVLNHANQNILVLLYGLQDDSPQLLDPYGLLNESEVRFSKTVAATLYTFSNACELLHVLELPGKHRWDLKRVSLKSHPNGLITLVNDKEAIMLKK